MTIHSFTRSIVISGAVVALASIPAYASGTNQVTSHTQKDHKVGICHATGSKTNPFVFISVDEHAAKAHAKHQDGRDILHVKSASDCPKVQKAAGGTSAEGVSNEKTSAKLTPAEASDDKPSVLPDTGAGLSGLLGVPALFFAGREYLRSRRTQLKA